MPPKILVVEDYPDLGELLCQILQRGGMAATLSPGGSQALRLAESNLPDAVLLDLMLPDIGGLDVCSRLKSNVATANIPVLFVTCAENENCFRDCFRYGAYDVLRKPYNPQHVVQTVFAALEWARSQKMAPDSGEFQIDPAEPKTAARGIEEMFARMSHAPQLFARLHEPMVNALGSFFYPRDAAAAGIPPRLGVSYRIDSNSANGDAAFVMHFHWTPAQPASGRSWFSFWKKDEVAHPWLKDFQHISGAHFESVVDGDVEIRFDRPQDRLTTGGATPLSALNDNASHR
jgi:DNA-binding response OmpR family regulator